MWTGFCLRRARQMIREEGAVDVDRLVRIVRRRHPTVSALPQNVPPPGKTPPCVYTILLESGLLSEASARAVRLRVKAAREGWIDE